MTFIVFNVLPVLVVATLSWWLGGALLGSIGNLVDKFAK